MTDREFVLASVLSDAPRGPTVVLGGRREVVDLTRYRLAYAQQRCQSIILPQGENTWEEAQNVIPQAADDLTICTSAFHQLRAFLTFLQAADYAPIRLWNLPVHSGMEQLAEELDKIEQYQSKGHCASYARAREYLAWRG